MDDDKTVGDYNMQGSDFFVVMEFKKPAAATPAPAAATPAPAAAEATPAADPPASTCDTLCCPFLLFCCFG